MKRIKIILSAAIVALLSLFAIGSSFKASAASNYIDITEYAESKSMYVAQAAGRGDYYYYINVSEASISDIVDFSSGYYIVAFSQTATNSPSGFFTAGKQFQAYSSYYHGYTFESSTVISMMNVLIPEAPVNGVAYTVAYNNTITSLNTDDEGTPYFVAHDLKACFDYNLGYDGGREPLTPGEDFKVYYVSENDDPVISYDKWYEQKAANAGNPLLLKSEQYFEGVSINSHVISDLTYLEIPFQKYIGATDKTGLNDTQIITFAQAVYELEGEIKTELVMYLYYPNYIYSGKQLKYAQVEFNFLEQEISNGSDWLIHSVASEYTDVFTSVSYYNNIIKFSWSSSVGDILLRPEDAGVRTTFNAKVKAFSPGEYNVKFDNLVEQEFQFFRGNVEEETTYLSSGEDNEHTYCIGNDYRTVSVNGETVRYRFVSSAVGSYYPTNLLVPGSFYTALDTAYTDFFYLYFDVEEDGVKWEDVTISSVNINYSVALVDIKYDSSRYGWFTKTNYDVAINYLTISGQPVLLEKYQVKDDELEYRYWSDEDILKYSELVHTAKITPDVIKFQYPKANFMNALKLTFNRDDYTKVTTELPTLFKTSDYNFQKFIEEAENIEDTPSYLNYQYGLMVGNKQGYAAISNYDTFGFLAYDNTGGNNTFYTLKVHGVFDIEIIENGERYLIKTDKANIDNSHVESPGDSIKPGDSNYPFPKEEEKEWWEIWLEQIYEFFNVTLPEFFRKFKTVFVGVLIAAGVLFLAAGIIKLVNFISAARTARNLDKLTKKE